MSECDEIYRLVDGERSPSPPTSRQGDPDIVDLRNVSIVKEKECHDVACLDIFRESPIVTMYLFLSQS